MNYILFDGVAHKHLLPLTFTRVVADIRIGIISIRKRWEIVLKQRVAVFGEPYLMKGEEYPSQGDSVFIYAAALPNKYFIEAIKMLKTNQKLVYNGEIIAFRTENNEFPINFDNFQTLSFEKDISILRNTWDIFRCNKGVITFDFEMLCKHRQSQPVPQGVQCINGRNIFIEEGATVSFSVLNASEGPIYIGKDATIMEGCLVRGPFSLGEKSLLKMGAKIYSGTSVGDRCKIGGEVNNSVIFSNSNKGHEGFLGNSIIGEWCNMGADSNTSNMKNNYGHVNVWSYLEENYIDTKLQFCGLVMGDHSKCGINTMFNTGSVVGVSSAIFGGGFVPKFVPSFVWGDMEGHFKDYIFKKAIKASQKMMERRKSVLKENDIAVLKHIFETVDIYRKRIVS